MPNIIDYHAMDDHDLLVMNTMQGNEIVKHLEIINGTQKNHEERLTIVEADKGIGKKVNLSKKQAVTVGGAVFIFGSFVAGIIERLL